MTLCVYVICTYTYFCNCVIKIILLHKVMLYVLCPDLLHGAKVNDVGVGVQINSTFLFVGHVSHLSITE